MLSIIWVIGVIIFAKVLLTVDQDPKYCGKRMSSITIIISSLLWFIALPLACIISYVQYKNKEI